MKLKNLTLTLLLLQAACGKKPEMPSKTDRAGNADVITQGNESGSSTGSITISNKDLNAAAIVPSALGSDAVLITAGQLLATAENGAALGLDNLMEIGASIRFLDLKATPEVAYSTISFVIPFKSDVLENLAVIYYVTISDHKVLGCLAGDDLKINKAAGTITVVNQGFGDYQAVLAENSAAEVCKARGEPGAAVPPTLTLKSSVAVNSAFGLAVDADRGVSYINGDLGFVAVSIADPAAPAVARTIPSQIFGGPMGPGRDVAVVGNVALQADTFGAISLNVANAQNPLVGFGQNRRAGSQIVANDTYAVIADNNGIQVLTTAVNFRFLGRFNTGAPCSGVAMDANIVVATCENGIYGIDAATLGDFNINGFMIEASPASAVALADGFAYVVGEFGLRVFEVSNPAAVKARGTLSEVAFATSIAIKDKYAVVGGVSGIEVFDVTSPDKPAAFQNKAILDTQLNIKRVVVAGDYVHALNDEGYAIIEMTATP